MICYAHNNRTAVSTCQECGRGLCNECTDRFTIPICVGCNNNRAKTEINSIRKELSISAIVFGISFFIMWGFFSMSEIDFLNRLFLSIMYSYFLGSTTWGWDLLKKMTPRVFLFMPLIGWIIYFVIKIQISLLIGWIVFPIQITRIFLRNRAIKSVITQQ